jgi:arylsulfatase A-like enzyme
MIYIEQPDGSGHQFLLTDPRQASNPRDPTSDVAPTILRLLGVRPPDTMQGRNIGLCKDEDRDERDDD